ncbi:MAG: glycosyltransferase family 39 protein [Thermoleophilaceae bacterium]|nr:glycosyltransferase family 39 protein [Thermoleophilaceae bacterium]
MHRLILALILVAGFALRVWNNDYGLPFVYSIDEASHFTSRAVEMFWQDLDPGYYQNPAAYTYLVYATLRVLYGPLGFLFGLPYGNVTDQFDKDPAQMWIIARTVAAVLGMAGVAATYAAAKRLWGVREGLVAAAVLAFAFLPVAYSRVAVTDVGALAGIALALTWSVRAADEGRTRDYALAGAAAGLAIAFKYTAGLVLLPLAIAALARLRADRARPLAGLVLGGLAAAVVFALLDPYVFGSLGDWWTDLRDQAEVAAGDPKPGQHSGGFTYYLDSLTWGLGWAGIAAALAGAVLVLRRDPVRGLVLVALPIVLFAYLALQSRYFGRWLLPAYPALAMLASVAVVRGAELLPRRGWQIAATAALALVVIAQPLLADVRTAQVLGREDTLSQARAFLDEQYPPGLRVSIEPAVPGRYFRSNPEGRMPAWLSRCPQRSGWTERGWSYVAAAGRRVCDQYKPGLFVRPDGGVRASSYHAVLGPDVIDDYRLYGYCLVVTVNVVRDRALEAGDRRARAYYERLERESALVREFSPYDKGSDPVPFSFDLSYNYYPPEYHRPGPTVRLHRLRDCDQAYGPPLIRIPKAREPEPFS